MNRATKSDSWVQNPDGTPGYTCSIITGCRMGEAHPYCFAQTLANGRLRDRYLANSNIALLSIAQSMNDALPQISLGEAHNDPFYPRFWPDRLGELDEFLTRSRKPVGIFLNIMGEWAGDWIPASWQDAQFEVINKHPRHRFYLLTHQPQNLERFSPFPDHCYVGVTATTFTAYMAALKGLMAIQAKIKFLSLEPLLEEVINQSKHHGFCNLLSYCHINWLIIGAMTGTKSLIMEMAKKYPELTPMPYGKLWTLQPQISWIEEIVRAADRAGAKVFLKENLVPMIANSLDPNKMMLYPDGMHLRQEMPG